MSILKDLLNFNCTPKVVKSEGINTEYSSLKTKVHISIKINLSKIRKCY